jgi:metallopeptidase MepB
MTKYAIPHSRDYIEVPSVLLENWGWEPEILAAIARNHRHEASQNDANTKIPNDVLSSIEINRGLFGANNMLPVLQRAMFDLVIHSPKTRQEALDMDVTNIWNTTRRDIANQSCNPEDWGWEEAAFGHLFRKYSAGVFAYAT